MTTDPSMPTARVRIEELLREAGTLLVVFAPLVEFALADRGRERWDILLFFLVLGFAFFVTAVVAERRRLRVD